MSLKKPPSQDGYILVVMTLFILIMMFLMPAITRHLSNQSRQVLKTKQSALALNLASAGIDRALWKLNEDSTSFSSARSGIPISGFTTATTYSDITGGDYRIQIGSGSVPGQVVIRAVGRDKTLNELRAVEAVVQRGGLNCPIVSSGDADATPFICVHWGTIISYSDIYALPIGIYPTTYFPMKISRRAVFGRDSDPTPPNTGADYRAYDSTVGKKPEIDLNYYKQRAKICDLPPDSFGNAVVRLAVMGPPAIPAIAGKAYYRVSDQTFGAFPYYLEALPLQTGGVMYSATSTVIFIENDVPVVTAVTQLDHLDVEAVILAGKHDFLPGYGATFFGATIPVAAASQYAADMAVWNNPNPPCTMGGSPSFASVGEGNVYNLGNANVHGFIYVGGRIQPNGSVTTIIGSVYLAGVRMGIETTDLGIFYDPAVAAAVRTTSGDLQLSSWREVPPQWP